MQWLDPSYRWAQLFPPLVILGWGVAERLRRRRIRRFGDPQFLGVSVNQGLRLAGLMLLAVGFATVAAVLPLPTRDSRTVDLRDSMVAILLDSRLSVRSPGAEYSLDDIDNQIRAVVKLAPASYFALFRSGEPLEMIVPPTFDSQALLILASRLLQEWQANPAASLRTGVESLIQRLRAGKARRIHIVAITAQPEPMPFLQRPSGDEVLEVVFVHLSRASTRSLPVASETGDGNWILSDRPEQLKTFLTGGIRTPSPSRSPLQDFSYIQILAAFGFFAILAESFLTQLQHW